jgi:hypothetical protein
MGLSRSEVEKNGLVKRRREEERRPGERDFMCVGGGSGGR